jgi:hypothetical protein
MKVLFLPEVRQYFQELENVLFEKEYFGFEEFAVLYVRELILDIENSLPVRMSKKASAYFNKYGRDMYYCSFRKNKQTQWYVFFIKYKEDGETIYLVRYISNNHMIAKFL